MITLTTPRQFAEFADSTMFVYVDLLKKTQLKNLEGFDKCSGEYLTARLINSLLTDVQLLFKKKLINTNCKIIKIIMSEAQAISFYKMLLTLPVPADHFYFNRIRNAWIEILDQQLMK